jgi:hypothetical protein
MNFLIGATCHAPSHSLNPTHYAKAWPNFYPSADLLLVNLPPDLPLVRTHNAAKEIGKAEGSAKV